MSRGGVMRIDLTAEDGQDQPVLRLDGRIPKLEPELTWMDAVGMPFAVIYLDGQRQYGVELWINGTLHHTVPPRSDEVDAVYDRAEAKERGELPSPGEEPASVSWEDRQTRLRRVQEEIAAHPGKAAYLRWHALRRTSDVHVRNGGELLEILDAVATDPGLALELVQNVRPPDVADEVNARIDQRLHNYVASAASLIDHSRNLFKHYEGQPVAAEYEARKNVLAAHPVNGFVRNLRNYALHRTLPWVGHNISFSGGGQDLTAVTSLRTAELLTWDGWSRLATEFLRGCGKEVDLRATIMEHLNVVQELNEWVFAQFQVLHQDEMADLNALQETFNWVLTGGRRGTPGHAP